MKYALLTSAESVRLAFEHGRTVQYAVDDQWVVMTSQPTDDEVESNLARGHSYRAEHPHANDQE